jgi:cation:H+ antiporter
MNDYLALALGVLCAAAGGELFVRGTVGLAYWARVSAGIIGATIAAFSTSSPELSVGINSALAGTPQISLGDVLGSNVVNIALILALALLIGDIQSSRYSVKRDFSMTIVVPVVIGLLAFDGTLSRMDGLLMMAMFWVWMGFVLREARRQRNASEDEVIGEHRGWLAILYSIVGLALLVTAGRLIVFGAKGLAVSFGIGEFVIGAVVVAVGTSVPELATTLIAKIKGHDEVSLGTIFGSNIFNGFFIAAIVAMIAPIPIQWHGVSVALAFGIAVVLVTLPARTGLIARWRGLVLLALYVVYIRMVF